MTFDEACTYLFTLPTFGRSDPGSYKPGLARIRHLARRLGNPHQRYPILHVAGTNGKGSTASMIAAIATAAGLKTGLHTSPHLFSFAERMRVDGVPADKAWIADATARVRPVIDEIAPSFFEASTALALLYFAESDVDVAVVEVGLGGRLDATNIVTPRLSVITSIGLDHTDKLGNTLTAVAGEKAGIVKPGAPLVTGATQPEVLTVLRNHAEAAGVPCHEASTEIQHSAHQADAAGTAFDAVSPVRSYAGLRVGLAGTHQVSNALVALRAAELALPAADEAAIRTGLANVRQLAGLRMRAEILHERPLIVGDVAHNPDGLDTALRFMASQGAGPLTVALGVMADKNVEEMATLLAQANATVIPVPVDSPRALPPDALTALLEAAGVPVLPAKPALETVDAFKHTASPDNRLLITGSHYVLAQLA
ncbi:MAG: folylpolyglutamate synthase/dihydrofolate synthase family protein [Bacteroidota bacterium]